MFWRIVHFLFFCKEKFKSLFELNFCKATVSFQRTRHDDLQVNGPATACMSSGKIWPNG